MYKVSLCLIFAIFKNCKKQTNKQNNYSNSKLTWEWVLLFGRENQKEWRSKKKRIVHKEMTKLYILHLCFCSLKKKSLALTYYFVLCFQSLLTLFHAFLIDVPINALLLEYENSISVSGRYIVNIFYLNVLGFFCLFIFWLIISMYKLPFVTTGKDIMYFRLGEKKL